MGRRIWTFGDNVDTDTITPSQYKHQGKESYVAHAMEPIEPNFGSEVATGDLVVAGRNFGSGSSRETAAIVFVEHEVEAIVAASFSRIFYRNAINLGLPVYVSPEASEGIEADHEVEIDHETGVLYWGDYGPDSREWDADRTGSIKDLRARQDRDDILGTLGDLLADHAPGNLVVIDSITDIETVLGNRE